MGLFSKTKKIAGWLSINLQADRIVLAHVIVAPGARPRVGMVASYPLDRALVGPTVDKLTRDLHLQRYQLTHLLNHGDYQLLTVDALNLPRDELKSAVRWRIKDVLDFPVDDAVIDVLDVPTDRSTPERKGPIYAVAASAALIRQRQQLFDDARLPLQVIDIPEMAQRNLSALLEPQGRGLALLSCDHDGVLLTITFGGELCLARRFDVSLAQLQHADVSARAGVYDRVTLELQRSFDHFESQFRFITVAKLMLAPLGDESHALLAHLGGNLYMPVEAVRLESLFDCTQVPDLLQPARQQAFFTALGAALRDTGGAQNNSSGVTAAVGAAA
ncbi:MAG: agglutinin biogenesis protein MshI [Pseudomonadota bacterium]|nr:agglutinin biogenesis protein MshI [Pseudomonadota bacterium]